MTKEKPEMDPEIQAWIENSRAARQARHERLGIKDKEESKPSEKLDSTEEVVPTVQETQAALRATKERIQALRNKIQENHREKES